MSKSTGDPSTFAPATSNYSYYTQLKTPGEMGMSSKGTHIAKNFIGLMEYMNLLTTGSSKASKTGKPLGNKFFSETLSKCSDTQTTKTVPRHLYFNYIPSGNIHIPMDITDLSKEVTINTGFKGLVPGIIEDLDRINPIRLMETLKEDAIPKCMSVTLDTINDFNQLGAEMHYLTLGDITPIDPCSFNTNINPVTNAKCKSPHKHPVPKISTKVESFANKTCACSPEYILVLCILLTGLLIASNYQLFRTRLRIV